MLIFGSAYATTHREQDLAMTLLFGGFSTQFYAAYEEIYPLTKGWRNRMALNQSYPPLVRVVLFGKSYAGQARPAVRRYL